MSVASQFEVQKYTVSQKKTSTFYFWNNSVKNWRILMIFGRMNFEKIWHENLTELFISLVRCSHFTLKNPKSHFQHYYSYILLIIYLRRKQTVIHLSTPPENVTTLTCKLQNIFIWLNVCCVHSNVGGSKENQLWVVVGGSEKSRLWCVATTCRMSGKQCHSKCSVWPPSALIDASSLFRHCSFA